MMLTKIETVDQLLLAARRKLRSQLGLALLAALLPACGAANPGEQEQAVNDDLMELEGSTLVTDGDADHEVLHEFAVANEQAFTFILRPSDTGVQEILIADRFTTVDHYAAVTERHGLLTSLETFLAFAPEGMEPHPALVAAHESEALGLGRADLTVKIVDGLEPEPRIDKVYGFCDTASFYNDNLISPLKWKEKAANFLVSIVDVDIFGCVGAPQVSGVGNPTGCETFHPSAMLRLYACNGTGSSTPMQTRFFTEGAGDPFTVNVAPGESRRVTRNPVQPPPGQPVIARRLAVRVRNTGVGGTGVIMGGMAGI